MKSNLHKSHSAIFTQWPIAVDRRKQAREIQRWLMRWEFTHFVTLTFSDPDAGRATLRGSNLSGLYLTDRLRRWDALVCRELLGRNWHQRPADRPFWAGLLEKPDHSPHFHMLMMFPPNDRHDLPTTHALFELSAGRLWSKLVPAGTVEIEAVTSQRTLAEYVLKSFHVDVKYDKLILPDEFSRWSTPGTAAAIARHATKACSP
ncbi:hypothetical protein [Pelagibacterium montanilacus]|uniref:hypothetical protein n=1 Tax=Pelagibacterium montanilacus TaxID=2185280 RepID=UPI000F8E4EC1|nr:hypothetical protein [Pelagibacterium montanilacus]